jgi:hypothetical protein
MRLLESSRECAARDAQKRPPYGTQNDAAEIYSASSAVKDPEGDLLYVQGFVRSGRPRPLAFDPLGLLNLDWGLAPGLAPSPEQPQPVQLARLSAVSR